MEQSLPWASCCDTTDLKLQSNIANFDSSWFTMEEDERSGDIFAEDDSMSWLNQEQDLPWLDQLPSVIGEDYMGIKENREYDLSRTLSCDSGYEDDLFLNGCFVPVETKVMSNINIVIGEKTGHYRQARGLLFCFQ